MEALAAKQVKNSSFESYIVYYFAQALEETKVNQVRIISELEKEKKKIREDVEKLKNAKVQILFLYFMQTDLQENNLWSNFY